MSDIQGSDPTEPLKSLHADGTGVPLRRTEEMVVHVKYEYRIMDANLHEDMLEFQHALNEMGEQGWRVVPMGFNETGLVILERLR